MSRTDELKRGGATDRTGSGGGVPFVKWDEDYAWVEGDVKNVWTGQYGDSATMEVTNVSPGLRFKGKDEDGREVQGAVKVGDEINVGLNSAALEGTITKDDQGKSFHVAFEGWQEPKRVGANRYRVFTVLDITPKGAAEPWPEDEEAEERAAVADDDSDLPF